MRTAALVGCWALLLLGCTSSDDGDKGGGAGTGTGVQLDWYSSSCGDLGGVETPAGACFVGCRSRDDCPVDVLTCTGTDLLEVGVCAVTDEAQADQGCGPSGWHDRSWGCYMKCFDGNDSECPSGFHCIEDPIVDGEYFCAGYAGSGTNGCNVPCESGCCSTTGNSCCRPPFCSGVCAGSPCC
jgi:hypothetical protein